jgi:uncharacterized protein (TIRG00374 family)
MKKIVSNAIKLIITAFIFYIILEGRDLNQIFSKIATAQTSYFLLSILFFFVLMGIFAFRWNIINHVYQVKRPVFELFRHHMIGLFFSNFLPSSIGGDVWRIYYLSEYTKSKSKAFLIALIERISGMVSITVLGAFSFIYFAAILDVDEVYISIFIFALIMIVILIFYEKTYRVLLDFFKKHESKKYVDKIIQLIETMSIIHEHKLTFLKAVMLSLSSQILLAVSSYFLAVSLNISMDVWQFILIIPIIYFVSIIPITINGYGLKESAYITLLVTFGVQENLEALPLTLLIMFVQIIVSLAGGLLFLFNKKEGKLVNES